MCNSLTDQAVRWIGEDVMALFENYADQLPTDELAWLMKDVIHLEAVVNGATGYSPDVVGNFPIGL